MLMIIKVSCARGRMQKRAESFAVVYCVAFHAHGRVLCSLVCRMNANALFLLLTFCFLFATAHTFAPHSRLRTYSRTRTGKMIPASVVEKEQARVTFEKEVRSGGAASLVEHVKGNSNRSRHRNNSKSKSNSCINNNK